MEDAAQKLEKITAALDEQIRQTFRRYHELNASNEANDNGDPESVTIEECMSDTLRALVEAAGGVAWTDEDSLVAFAEGWNLFEHGAGVFAIERDDETRKFTADEFAILYVGNRATDSDLHRRAFLLHLGCKAREDVVIALKPVFIESEATRLVQTLRAWEPFVDDEESERLMDSAAATIETLNGEIASLVKGALAYDTALNDDARPGGAQAPTGDDYNALMSSVMAAAVRLKIVDRWPS
jgi:hypothetical protein